MADTHTTPSEGRERTQDVPVRSLAVKLCCAPAFEDAAHQVAERLIRYGFKTKVVCGENAQAALLGRSAEATREPTIHVVCVAGKLRERVLDPLKRAFARHGRRSQHLIVAVLDPDQPLALVSQVVEFAAKLEIMRTGSHKPSRGTRPLPVVGTQTMANRRVASALHRALEPSRRSWAQRWAPAALLAFGGLVGIVGVSVAFDAGELHGDKVIDARDSSGPAEAAIAVATIDRSQEGPRVVRVENEPTAEPELLDKATRLQHAIEKGKVFALERLHVARPSSGTVLWADARRHCRRMSIDGITGWRLPTLRELRALDVVGLVRTGTFWSRSTSREDPDEVRVRDVARNSEAILLKSEPTAKPVCVRTRRQESSDEADAADAAE